MRRHPGQLQVSSLATCKRCGNTQVAWVQSRAGKFYLVEANVVAGTHEIVAQRFNFHSKNCKPTPDQHDTPMPTADRLSREYPTRNERMLESGYNAYAREEGYYD